MTLEPCSHVGRTPPCADALIEAGVAGVQVAIIDPDPNVAGAAPEKLRAAGIDVTAGDGEAESAKLLEAYLKHRATGLPFVIAKFAATLDGKIAASSGDFALGRGPRSAPGRIASAPASTRSCAASTTCCYDPRLTARPGGGAAELQPLRIVADSRGRTPLGAKVLGPGGKTLIATTDASPSAWRDEISRRRRGGLRAGDGREWPRRYAVAAA